MQSSLLPMPTFPSCLSQFPNPACAECKLHALLNDRRRDVDEQPNQDSGQQFHASHSLNW